MICSSSSQQVNDVEESLKNIGIQPDISLGETSTSQFEKKNISNLSFLMKLSKFLFFGIQSLHSFSYLTLSRNQSNLNLLERFIFNKTSLFGRRYPSISNLNL